MSRYAQVANYIIQNNVTKQEVAEHFNLTKIQVNECMKSLNRYNKPLYERVKQVLNAQANIINRTNTDYKPRYKQIADYIINNNASRLEVIREFNINKMDLSQTIIYIKRKDFNLYSQLINILKSNSAQDDFKYMKVAKYMIENNASIEAAAKHFNVSINTLYGNIYIGLRKNNPRVFLIVQQMLKQTRDNNRKYRMICDWIIKNNASRKESIQHFGKYSINAALNSLSYNDKETYNKIQQIFDSRKDRQYVHIAEYMIEHNVGYMKAARYFNISPGSVSTQMGYIKVHRPDLYEKLDAGRKVRYEKYMRK